MEIDEIRKLIRLMEEAGLSELEIEDRSGKVRLVRGRPRGSAAGQQTGEDDGSRPYGNWRDVDEASGGAADSVSEPRAAERVAPGTIAVTSPMVGTFYRAPAPDAAPFVNVGELVQIGQVLCVIEAMKMMNEIHAETAGRVLNVLAENGASVEYGSPLFLLELLE